jgi:hypothetical protein
MIIALTPPDMDCDGSLLFRCRNLPNLRHCRALVPDECLVSTLEYCLLTKTKR